MSLRLDTPPPDAISLDDSPFSSSHQISIDDLESPPSVEPLTSPQKRLRGHTVSKQAGRSAKRRLDSGLLVLEGPTRGEPPVQEDTVPSQSESGLMDGQLSLVDDGPATHMTAYPEYVDSVLAGAAGFFQVAFTVFVVQGWDSRIKSAMVGMSCFYLRSSRSYDQTAFLVSLTKSDLRW